ncbi:MAG: hypothetical protein F9K30_07705 [Dechloromonas sp.]|nr:MAG: hypothetical protein F9K30_07705 [Dechloromonas sp.]
MLAVKDKATELLEAQLPRVRAKLEERLGPTTRELIGDDALMTRCLGEAYEFLPAPVRMMVKRERFVSFCLERRDRLIAA